MKIVNHRLQHDGGTPYDFRRSPNQSRKITPEYLIMHYTAGRSAEGSISWLVNPAAKASAHLVVARDGTITQLVAFNRKAWHAGRSRWAGRDGVNGFSIGIELDNPGILTRRGSGWTNEWGAPVDAADVVEAPHSSGGPMEGWCAYSNAQLEATLEVATLLGRRYDLKDVLGHDDVAPGRKVDPGPAFPMRSFRAAVVGREEDTPETYVTITDLNIRTGAGTQHDKLAVSPLPAGTELSPVGSENGWVMVDVLGRVKGENDIQGWVHGRYVRPVT